MAIYTQNSQFIYSSSFSLKIKYKSAFHCRVRCNDSEWMNEHCTEFWSFLVSLHWQLWARAIEALWHCALRHYYKGCDILVHRSILAGCYEWRQQWPCGCLDLPVESDRCLNCWTSVIKRSKNTQKSSANIIRRTAGASSPVRNYSLVVLDCGA